MRFILGVITGAGLAFMFLASGLWYKLRAATNGQIGLSAIAGVTIGSPVFWGVGLGIALIALGLIFRYAK